MFKLACLLFALTSSSSLKSLTMEIREKDSLNLISSRSLSEKDISRLTQAPKHERNHEHLRRSRRSFPGRSDDYCQTKMEQMDSAAVKRHLCQKHFEKIRNGIKSMPRLSHSEVENHHCASNLIIPHRDEGQFMPTSCELTTKGNSLKNKHSCLEGTHHCDAATSKKLCNKISIFYEKTLPSAGHKVEEGWIDVSRCKEVMRNHPVLSCDEVKTSHSQELLASKIDFYYIVTKREDSGQLVRSKMEFEISIRNHAICGAKLELRQN